MPYIQIKNATTKEFYIKQCRKYQDSCLSLGILLLDDQNHYIKLEQEIAYSKDQIIIERLLSICKVDSSDKIINKNVRVAFKGETAIAIGDEKSWLRFDTYSIEIVSENELIYY